MSNVEATVYNGAGNAIDLQLTEDGVVLPDHSLLTRAVLDLDGAESIDSDTDPAYFDLTQTDKISLLLGNAGLLEGRYWATLTVYSADHPGGLAWQPAIKLKVV